jgi:hypothetical protein
LRTGDPRKPCPQRTQCCYVAPVQQCCFTIITRALHSTPAKPNMPKHVVDHTSYQQQPTLVQSQSPDSYCLKAAERTTAGKAALKPIVFCCCVLFVSRPLLAISDHRRAGSQAPQGRSDICIHATRRARAGWSCCPRCEGRALTSGGSCWCG